MLSAVTAASTGLRALSGPANLEPRPPEVPDRAPPVLPRH